MQDLGPIQDEIRQGRLLYTAVETSDGVHVTPQVFALSGGRIWTLSLRGSLKSRSVRRDPRIGALVPLPEGRSVMIGGSAKTLDPLRPWDLPGAARELMAAPLAMASYLSTNATEVLKMAKGTLSHPGELIPPTFVVQAISPVRAAVVADGKVVDSWGEWPLLEGEAGITRINPSAEANKVSAPRASLEEIPDDLAELAAEGGPAVLGWETKVGPVAFPATWNPSRSRVSVPVELFILTDAAMSSRCCVTIDEGEGGDRVGVILRGDGTATLSSETAFIAIDAEKASFWSGASSSTVALKG